MFHFVLDQYRSNIATFYVMLFSLKYSNIPLSAQDMFYENGALTESAINRVILALCYGIGEK